MFNKGDIVRFKGSNDIFVVGVPKVQGYNDLVLCDRIGDDGKLQHMTFRIETLEILTEQEIAKIRKKEDIRKDAIAGITLFDNINKTLSPIAASIGAIGVIILGLFNSCQSNKLDEMDKKIERILKYQNTIEQQDNK